MVHVDHDLRRLAGLARQALSAGWEATLLVTEPCQDPLGPQAILQDRDGRPVFSCPATSPMLACAGQAALLTFDVPEWVADQATVVLAGHLRVLPKGHSEQQHPGVRSMTLDVAQVIVECADLTAGERSRQVVPLDIYQQADMETLARHASSVIEHTNDHHARELRESVAQHLGIPPEDVAAASLLSLDRFGARILWVDESGSHAADMWFDDPADGPSELARVLRAHLHQRAG